MTLNKLKKSVIINVDNYDNECLNDPIYMKYVIDFSEKGGASAFLTNKINNFKIIRENVKLPIFFELEVIQQINNFEDILQLKPNFIVINIVDIRDQDQIYSLISSVRNNFKGEIIARISTRYEVIMACKVGVDGIIVDIFENNFDKDFIKQLCLDMNLMTIVSINSTEFNICKQLIDLGIHCFILGEDITNPNKILARL